MRKNNLFKLDILILSVLSREDNYGYGITTTLKEESEGNFQIKEGVMYPILYRMLEAKMISKYEKMFNNRTRVYYKLEDKGREELLRQVKRYKEMVEHVDRIIDAGYTG